MWIEVGDFLYFQYNSGEEQDHWLPEEGVWCPTDGHYQSQTMKLQEAYHQPHSSKY